MPRRAAPARWSASTSTAVIEIAEGERLSQRGVIGRKPRFVQADIFPWLRDAGTTIASTWSILDPAKMTRDREQVINALKKYLDMNKLALGVVKPGGLFATFSYTGLVSEDQFLDMLRRAAFYAGRTVQVLKGRRRRPGPPVAGAGAGIALFEGCLLPGARLMDALHEHIESHRSQRAGWRAGCSPTTA